MRIHLPGIPCHAVEKTDGEWNIIRFQREPAGYFDIRPAAYFTPHVLDSRKDLSDALERLEEIAGKKRTRVESTWRTLRQDP